MEPHRLKRLRKKVLFSIRSGLLVYFLALRAFVTAIFHRRNVSPLTAFSVRGKPLRLPQVAGINLAIRIRLNAAAASVKFQSTRRRPRNLVFLSPATTFIHPKIFSTNFRLL